METLASSPALEPHRFYHYLLSPFLLTHTTPYQAASQEEPSQRHWPTQRKILTKIRESPYETSRSCPSVTMKPQSSKFHPLAQSFSSWVYEQMVIGPLTWKATNMEIRDLNKLKNELEGNSSYPVSLPVPPYRPREPEKHRGSVPESIRWGQAGE